MILDSIANLGNYSKLIPNSEIAIEYISRKLTSDLPVGKYDLLDERAFVLVQEYQTEFHITKNWETHRKYIDIHIMLDGNESVYYYPVERLKLTKQYDEGKDFAIYEALPTGVSLELDTSLFCLFYPGEAHKPGCHEDSPRTVKKAVIKLLAH